MVWSFDGLLARQGVFLVQPFGHSAFFGRSNRKSSKYHRGEFSSQPRLEQIISYMFTIVSHIFSWWNRHESFKIPCCLLIFRHGPPRCLWEVSALGPLLHHLRDEGVGCGASKPWAIGESLAGYPAGKLHTKHEGNYNMHIYIKHQKMPNIWNTMWIYIYIYLYIYISCDFFFHEHHYNHIIICSQSTWFDGGFIRFSLPWSSLNNFFWDWFQLWRSEMDW